MLHFSTNNGSVVKKKESNVAYMGYKCLLTHQDELYTHIAHMFQS